MLIVEHKAGTAPAKTEFGRSYFLRPLLYRAGGGAAIGETADESAPLYTGRGCRQAGEGQRKR
ncbi:hypothetical protein DPM33_30080 [Mesorhizobium hawassense]|uniref:Uncharacterized protein n=1 Tax=Mesorhizobium hawassense TaxID=1209954 RepID=A0A330HAI9_9HYPH|nr:hypothetical protein DPM33_30080 [Mesorhizobium hawassense]